MLSLREAEKNVTQISEDLGVEQSKVSHALASLKHCHIVVSKTNGKERIYSLNKDTIVPILKIIDKHSSFYCKGDCRFKKEMIDNKKELNAEKVGVV
jgi:DNA-binding transcriptional ArsR family regulator